MFEGLIDQLPNIGIALGVVVGGVLLARLLRKILEPRLSKRRTPSFGRVMSRLAGFGVITFTSIIALTIVFPSVQPVDMLAGLGVFSIAIGFAFQDILSNLLAGLLLLIREPFQGGDQIEVNGHKGTVEGITIRETQIKTFDGKRVIVPNKDVYQSAIEIQTAFDKLRTSLLVGVGYDDDLDMASGLAVSTLKGIDGVLSDPEPQALCTEFGDSAITIDLRYWTKPEQAEVRKVQHRAVVAIKKAFDDEMIDMPFPVRTLEFATPSDADLRIVTETAESKAS